MGTEAIYENQAFPFILPFQGFSIYFLQAFSHLSLVINQPITYDVQLILSLQGTAHPIHLLSKKGP